MKNNIVILLSACVNPNGMAFTAIQNFEERIVQYQEAILYYIENTVFKIVVVENTLFDFTTISAIQNSRIEYISFDGNTFNKTLGKGYGEALIIEHALQNSVFLNNAEYIIKITGRLMIKNINNIVNSLHLNKLDYRNNVFANTTWNRKLTYSYFFIANRPFLHQYFLPLKCEINDSDGVYFENVLMRAIILWEKDGHEFNVFKKPIFIGGKSGSTGGTYSNTMQFFILKIPQYFKSMYFKYKKTV